MFDLIPNTPLLSRDGSPCFNQGYALSTQVLQTYFDSKGAIYIFNSSWNLLYLVCLEEGGLLKFSKIFRNGGIEEALDGKFLNVCNLIVKYT